MIIVCNSCGKTTSSDNKENYIGWKRSNLVNPKIYHILTHITILCGYLNEQKRFVICPDCAAIKDIIE
jgi:hypothetical protein